MNAIMAQRKANSRNDEATFYTGICLGYLLATNLIEDVRVSRLCEKCKEGLERGVQAAAVAGTPFMPETH
jgi:hypothetical protein